MLAARLVEKSEKEYRFSRNDAMAKLTNRESRCNKTRKTIHRVTTPNGYRQEKTGDTCAQKTLTIRTEQSEHVRVKDNSARAVGRPDTNREGFGHQSRYTRAEDERKTHYNRMEVDDGCFSPLKIPLTYQAWPVALPSTRARFLSAPLTCSRFWGGRPRAIVFVSGRTVQAQRTRI